MIRRLLAVLALAATLSARAQESTIQAKGSTTFDAQTGEIIMTGGVIVKDPELYLTADELRQNEKTDTLTAIGHVVATRGNRRLLADKIVLHRKEQTFEAEHVRVGVYPIYVDGEAANGTFQVFTVVKATVSYREPGPWQPTFTADQLTVGPGQRIHTEHAQAGIGTTRPLPIPRIQQDLYEPAITVTSLNGGYRSTLGAFLEAGVHLPVALGVHLGGDVGIYTNRGLLVGPSGSYNFGQDGLGASGYFRSGYINDHGDKKTDVLGRPVPEDRAYFEWQHEQQITKDLSVDADINWWRDSEILRDFRPHDFYNVQEPDTFVESLYKGDNYFLSAFFRLQPNNFDTVQERLPEIRFDLMPTALGGGVYERFNASVVALREAPPLGGTILRSDRVDAYYELERPITPTDWFVLNPVLGTRLTGYTNISGTAHNGDYGRALGEVGFDAALRSSGTFDYKNSIWKIDGLRHLLTPRLSYRYIPEGHSGSGIVPDIDRDTFSTYLPPLGLGDQRNVDELHAQNKLRFEIDNTLQTRDAKYGSRDLLSLNVAADFLFRHEAPQRPLSEIHTDFAVSPASWLDVGVYNTFVPQSFTLDELNSAVTLHDGNVWSVRFNNNYLRNQIQDYHVEGRYRINEQFDILTRLEYDARKRRFNEQAYGVTQNLDNTWLISYIVSLYSGPRRESHFGLNVQIETTRF